MTRIRSIDPAQAEGKARLLLDAVNAKLGMTPNMTRTMATSPAVLEGYLSFNAALAGGRLGPKLREQIALATAELNSCEYCLSAHSTLGRGAGLTTADIEAARRVEAADARSAEALRFVEALLVTRGNVADAAVARVRDAGFSDGEIAEIIADVALNVFTNYFNKATRPAVDFPVVTPHALPRAA